MIVSFDENVLERDCIVLFKFNGEFDTCVTNIEVLQELGCRVFIVERGESIVYVSKPNRRASVVVEEPLLFKMAHKDVGQNRT